MFNTLLDFLVCGGSMCGVTCGRWTKALQDDDADLWKDLTLQNLVPDPRAPPVPRVVRFPDDFDDVSTLNDPHQIRSKEIQNETLGDLELRVESFDEDVGSFDGPGFRSISREFYDLGDGSSYSSFSRSKRTAVGKSQVRQQTLSWQTDSTDATMQTQNIVAVRAF
jgi:hypothetical protein